jgi:hypothetical protein
MNNAMEAQGSVQDDYADESVLQVIGSLPLRSLEEQLALLRTTLSILEAYAEVPDGGSLVLTPNGVLFRLRYSVGHSARSENERG